MNYISQLQSLLKESNDNRKLHSRCLLKAEERLAQGFWKPRMLISYYELVKEEYEEAEMGEIFNKYINLDKAIELAEDN